MYMERVVSLVTSVDVIDSYGNLCFNTTLVQALISYLMLQYCQTFGI